MVNEIHPERDSAETHDEAFAQVLARRTMPKVYIPAIVRDPHLAEHALLDTTLTIARSWRKFDQRPRSRPWAAGPDPLAKDDDDETNNVP